MNSARHDPLPVPGRVNWRHLVMFAVALGFVFRLAFGFGYWVDKPLTHDEREYLSLARNLAVGKGFVHDPPPPTPEGVLPPDQFGRAPLYPIFLSIVARGHLVDAGEWTSTPAPVKVAQAAVGAIGVWLIALLATRAAGPFAGSIAAMAAAIYPPLVWICAYVLSEALYSVLALASALVLTLAIDRASALSGTSWRSRSASPCGRRVSSQADQSRRRVRLRGDEQLQRWGGASALHLPALAFVAGALAGLATLTRPAMLFFIGLVGLWGLGSRRFRLVSVFTLGAVLLIAPWTVRNVREHQRFVLIASEGGVTFWTGNHPAYGGEGDMASNPAIKRANQEFRGRHAGLSPEDMEPLYYREAFQHIADRPIWWTGLLARKLFHFWVPIGPSYTERSTLYYGATLVSYGLVLPFAVAGFVMLRRAGARFPALWLLLGSAVIAPVLFLPQERFRIPVVDPVLIVCASAWLSTRLGPSHLGPG